MPTTQITYTESEIVEVLAKRHGVKDGCVHIRHGTRHVGPNNRASSPKVDFIVTIPTPEHETASS
jgi:hypothetical protein